MRSGHERMMTDVRDHLTHSKFLKTDYKLESLIMTYYNSTVC